MCEAAVTGLSATGQVGTVSVVTDQIFSVTGVSATGQLGNVSLSTDQIILVVGVSGTGLVGTSLVWSVIDDNQNANWQNIDARQLVPVISAIPFAGGTFADETGIGASSWNNISTTQNPNWTRIAA